MAEPPEPAPMTCSSASRSTPVAAPDEQRLADASRALTAATALLISLIISPWPSGPTWTISSPIASSSGRARSKSARVAAGHDRQRAVLGLRRGAGHRRVDEADAALGERGADAARVGGRDRRHVDAQQPGPRAVRRRRPRRAGPPRPAAPSTTIVMTTSASPRDLRGRGGHGGAVLLRPRVGGRAGAVADDELVPGAAQVGRHPRAHDPQADEADSHACQRTPPPD